jgi:hypothetical protein
MALWALIGGLAAAAVALLVVSVLLVRARSAASDTARITEAAKVELRAVVSAETDAHREEIRRTLARERAESLSLLAAEERRLADEGRAAFIERERRAGEGHAATIAASERRLDDRMRGYADDLDRAQLHLETQLERLTQRQREAIADVEARLDMEASEFGSAADEQRRAVLRLREELARAASQAVSEALDELESQTVERRRAIEEISERLRARETAVADSVERAETDVRARLDVLLVEWERRQTERLQRVAEREIEHHIQIASQAFDERMREIREEASTRLRRELDRAVESLAREEFVRRVDEIQS